MKNCSRRLKKSGTSVFFKSCLNSRLFILVLCAFTSYEVCGQSPVTGVVTSGDTAVAGVSVQVRGTNNTVQSDAQGRFTINAPGDATLELTHISFEPLQVKVNNRSSLTIQMTPLTGQLSDVVVIGYGSQRRKDVVGAVSSISGQRIAERPVSTFDQALQGLAPGLQIAQRNSSPGELSTINLRGIGSLSPGFEPLFVVDGFPTDQRNATAINPADIQSIDILKDAASTAIYGSRGANGVIIITTKTGRGKAQLNVNISGGVADVNKRDLYDAAGAAEYVQYYRIVGEARFLRASTYFHLVRGWGDVALKVTESKDFGDVIQPRASQADVYSFIVSELTAAASVLPQTYPGGEGHEIGRATWGAAMGLLGKVQLQEGNNAEAVTALQAVVGSNLYSLLPEYSQLSDPANENTAKSLFEIQFEPANQTGSPHTSALIPPGEANALGIVAGGNAFAIRPTADMVNAYEAGDERKDASLRIDAGGLPYIIKYLDLSAAASGARNNFPVLRYSDVLLLLAEAMGESQASYGLINTVRNRAGLADIDASTPGTFIEKVQHERRVELAFEGQRWYDLLRLPDQEVIEITSEQLSDQFGRSIQLTSSDLLYPIAIAEIETSGGIITQNEGY